MRLLKTKWQLDEVVKYIRHDINFDAKCQGVKPDKEKLNICNTILKEKDFEVAVNSLRPKGRSEFTL